MAPFAPKDRTETDGDAVRVHEDPGRYAVLLNALAKGWSGELHQSIQKLVPSRDLYLTDDFRQAERTVDLLLNRDYDVIFTGGGDGTIMFLVNAIERRIKDGDLDRDEAPPVGVLRMGSGNAIATYLGQPEARQKLKELRSGASLAVHSLHMLRGSGALFPFAGIGWDAELLNDYEAFKEMVRDTAFEPYATGLTGYIAAAVSRTLPRVLQKTPVHMTIENRGEAAYRIDSDGEVLETYGPGDILYDGEIQTCATASIAYWGYRIRMFPHATRRRGYAMLRCFNGSVGRILRHLPSFWRGRFPGGDCTDFLYKDVEVRTRGEALPYQKTGEGAGYEREIGWEVPDHPVRLAVPL